MKYFKWFILTSLILGICSFAFSGTMDPSTPDYKYTEYGEKFHCVVPICGSYQDDSLFCASAVVIDDHHILTAAHVVKDCKTCYITIGSNKYYISTVVINKDFDKEFGVGDIAIGYCEESFKLDFYPKLYEETNEEGKICSIAGYGLHGTFLTGGKKHDGKKRAGSNKINRIFRDTLLCDPSKRHEEGFTELEFCIASGDSGGGLFIDGKLAGINSFIMSSSKSPNGLYGEEACHTRVSKFVSWINENKLK